MMPRAANRRYTAYWFRIPRAWIAGPGGIKHQSPRANAARRRLQMCRYLLRAYGHKILKK